MPTIVTKLINALKTKKVKIWLEVFYSTFMSLTLFVFFPDIPDQYKSLAMIIVFCISVIMAFIYAFSEYED
jgi:hypothetical protein